MDAANSSNGNYIPITTQEVLRYVQASSIVSHAPSTSVTAAATGQGSVGDDVQAENQLSLLQSVSDSGHAYGDSVVVVPISSAASSSSSDISTAPPSYVISAVASQNVSVPSLQLQPIPAIESAAIGQPPAYQIDLQHGISTLAAGAGHHPHYQDVWLSTTVPHGLKGSIPNSVPLPPVSEVHPSRGPKLAPRLVEGNSTASTQQLRSAADDSDHRSNLHSYLAQVLPNIQDSSATVKVPAMASPAVSMPQQHHDHLLSATTAEQLSSAGLLTDVSSVASIHGRASNIYSIAPSQATAVSGSHALTLDTNVHKQLSALMEHHSHDSGHFPNTLLQLGLSIDAELDKHHQQQIHHPELDKHVHQHIHHQELDKHLHQHQIHHPELDKHVHQQQIHHSSDALIGSTIPMTTADISNVLAEHRTQILDNFNVIYSSSGGGNTHVELSPQKHNHMPQQEGSAQLIAAAIHLPADLGSIQLSEHPFQQNAAAGGEAKDLVETLACYRCKVCPFISFSKEGVEQHVRSTHLKQEVEGVNAPTREDIVPELCAQEIEINQQPSVDGEMVHVKPSTYVCGVCEMNFPEIEPCSVHMAMVHDLPVDQVHLEPLPAMVVPEVQEPQPPAEPLHQTRPLQPLLPAQPSIVQQPQKLDDGQRDDSQQLQRCGDKMAADKKRQAVQDHQQTQEAAKPKVVRRRKAIKKLQQEDVDKGEVAPQDGGGKEGGGCVTIKQEAEEKREGGAENQDSCGEANADSADSSLNNAKSGAKKRGRPRGSKTLGITAMKKKNRSSKATEDHLLGFRCDVHGCAVRMQSLENLEYHRKCHTDDVEHFECPECNARYDNWKSTSVHLWRTHVVDMELYSCDLCSYKTYSYGKLMNMHRRIHSDERLFMCDVCGRCFKTNKQLRNHKVIHLDKRKNRSFRSGECDICNRHFSDKRMLRVHKDTVHNKLRPYLCQYCSYTASCRSTLKMHIRQHTGEKPFACEMCDYRTADHNSLRRHKMRHSGEKPYKCPFCPYKSIQSSTYKTHLKNKHPGLDEGLLFSCDYCPFRTIKKENYVTHMADHKNGGHPVQIPAGAESGGQQGGTMTAVATASTATSMAPDSGYFSPHAQSSSTAEVGLQSQMEVVPFIFSVPDEMRHRISQQQIYAVVDSDNPEERFPILASQLKIGQVVGNQRENQEEEAEHEPRNANASAEASRHHIHAVSPHEQRSTAVAAPQQQPQRESNHAATSSEQLSHAQLTPVPPETILPN